MADARANHPHYHKYVGHLQYIDVYRVLALFEVNDPAIAHAVKKLLVPGKRGAGKSREQDIREAVTSLNRALQMIAEDDTPRPAQAPALNPQPAQAPCDGCSAPCTKTDACQKPAAGGAVPAWGWGGGTPASPASGPAQPG